MYRPLPFSRAWLAALALSFAVAAAGCATTAPAQAGSVPSTTPVAAPGFPVEVVTGTADSSETITLSERPDAIVSLSPSATETLFAIGAGDQVVAVDDQSNHPAEAPRTDLSGFQPNVEGILGEEPDLVLVAMPDPELVAALAAAEVPTLVLPAVDDLEGVYEQVERVGLATGRTAEANALVTEMRTEIEAALAGVPDAAGATYFHELDPTLYTVGSNTFIAQIYSLFGLTNIADAAGSADAYPQLSDEFVVEADPDVVFLADAQCCGVTPDVVAERPGWAGLDAVLHDRIVVLDADVASRWGPRVVDQVKTVADAVATLEAANT